MKRILTCAAFTALATLAALAALAAAGPDAGWVFNDSNAKVKHDCGKQPRVIINASNDEVTLVGACSRVTVNGDGDRLTVESAVELALHGADNSADVGTVARIAVTGAQNRVTWRAAAAGKRPRIQDLGAGDTIAKAP